MAELVDALVLGTSGVTRGGSSPFIRTISVVSYQLSVISYLIACSC